MLKALTLIQFVLVIAMQLLPRGSMVLSSFKRLANERFGSYWLNKGFESIAYPFIQEALYLYRQWGCQAKVEQLRKQVNDFLPQFKTRIPLTISHSTLKESQESQALDMASVMKSAQLISSGAVKQTVRQRC